MYRQNYSKNELSVSQTLDFTTLRKTSVQANNIQGGEIVLQNQPNIAIILIAGYSLILRQVQFQESQFLDFNFEQIPKAFLQYQHEKTMSEIFNILRNKIKCHELLADFLNNYPIAGFALECWARQKTKIWIEQNPPEDSMGNQNQILMDLSYQIRGPLLGLIASCFGFSIKIQYSILEKPTEEWDIFDIQEQLGDANSKNLIYLEYHLDGNVAGKLVQRDLDLSASQPLTKGEGGFLRRSKIGEMELETRSGEFKSAKKDRPIVCEKCGATKKCECNTIKRKGLGATPKSTQQINSSMGGFKTDPLNLGLSFLNANNLSKIRDNRHK